MTGYILICWVVLVNNDFYDWKHNHCRTDEMGRDLYHHSTWLQDWKPTSICSEYNDCHILGLKPTRWIRSRGRRLGEQFPLYWYLWRCLRISIVNSLLSSWTWSNHKRTKYYWPQVTTSPALVQTISSVPFPHSSLPKHDVGSMIAQLGER